MSAYSIATRGLAGRKVPQGVLTPMDDLLFSASEPGAWYDPSDMSTLWQDSAGTTPVTAVEQPVGRMLDKSGRGNHAIQATTTKRPVLSRRVNLITGSEMTGGDGGTPGTAPDGWQIHIITDTYSHTVEGGKHRFAATSGRSTIRNPINWQTNTTYIFEFKVLNNSFPVTVSTVAYLGLQSATGVSLQSYVDGVISSQINPGLHNVKIIASFTGGTPLGFAYMGVGAGSPSSGDITLIDSSLTLATDAHLPYQRVNTDTDYDADPAKFPAYLRFDGVDDAMQTGNIDFTGTDKMTVWAGVTKLSDPATGSGGTVMLELTSNGNGPGSVSLFGTWTSVAAGNPGFACSSAGTARANAVAAGAATAAPFSGPVTVAASIPTPALTLRANGSVIASSSTSLGTGTYANAALYIGARVGISQFFNGRLYGLIVRGAQSTLSQIEATELYMKKKVGIA